LDAALGRALLNLGLLTRSFHQRWLKLCQDLIELCAIQV